MNTAAVTVVSTVSGRLRVRSRRLKSPAFARELAAKLGLQPGVLEVHPNPAASSLAVLFDADEVDLEQLEDEIESLCDARTAPTGRAKGGARLSPSVNRIAKIGMVSSLGTSMAFAALGRKKPHIAFGTAFLAFAGVHMFHYSNRLLR